MLLIPEGKFFVFSAHFLSFPLILALWEGAGEGREVATASTVQRPKLGSQGEMQQMGLNWRPGATVSFSRRQRGVGDPVRERYSGFGTMGDVARPCARRMIRWRPRPGSGSLAAAGLEQRPAGGARTQTPSAGGSAFGEGGPAWPWEQSGEFPPGLTRVSWEEECGGAGVAGAGRYPTGQLVWKGVRQILGRDSAPV